MEINPNQIEQKNNSARQSMNILGQVLKRVDNPSQLGDYITEQMHELTGAHTALLYQYLQDFGETEYRNLSVSPESHQRIAESTQMKRLISLFSKEGKEVTVWGESPKGDEAEKILAEMGIGLSAAIPINIGDNRLGVLLLLDLPDKQRLSDVLETLGMLSTIIALVLLNSILHQQQEMVIKKRILDLAKSEQVFRSLAEASPVGIFRTDEGGNCTYVNERWCQITGFSSEEVKGKGWLRGLHPDDRSLVLKEWGRTIEKNQPFKAEFRFQKPNGETTWLYSQAVGEKDCQNRITGYIGAITDISNQKQAEEALHLIARQWHATFDSINNGIMLVDSKFRILQCNKAIYDLIKKTPDEVVGHRCWEIMHQATKPISECPFMRTFKSHKRESSELQWGDRWIQIILDPRFDEEGHLLQGIHIITDITERKRAEGELNKYRCHLEQLVKERTAELTAINKELEAFSYSISHDLRAPLRAINGFSHILGEEYSDQIDERGKDYLHRIERASHHMSDLIDDLLKLSRLTRSEVHFEQVNLSKMVQNIADDLKRTQPERQVEFIVPEAITAFGDKHLLEIVLTNLLDNAWKFTSQHPTARIEFGTMQKDDKTVYYLRDDGAGFDESYTEKLFAPFQRLHSPSEFEGTGIGLATVRRIINRHGGSIWAESKVEQGATFYFTLSVQPPLDNSNRASLQSELS